MSAIEGYVACPYVQTGLAELFLGNGNTGLGSKGNLTKFLLSATNTDGFAQSIIASNGKLKTIEAVYRQRSTVDDVEDGGIISCAEGAEEAETSKLYTLDPSEGSRISWSVTTSEIRTRCEADANFVNRLILDKMNAIVMGVEKKSAEKLVLNTGNFASDVDAGNPAGTSTYKEGVAYVSGAINYGAFEAVTFENMNNDFNQVPVVFGGESWFKYAKAIGAACCGDDGIDAGLYASQNPMLFAFSREVTTAIGEAEAAISVIPGMVQMITANEFENEILAFNNGGALFQGVLMYPDPTLPLMFDYRAEYKCTEGGVKKWHFELALSHDLIFYPEDAYKVGDRLEGVNGVNEFRLCGAKAACPAQA